MSGDDAQFSTGPSCFNPDNKLSTRMWVLLCFAIVSCTGPTPSGTTQLLYSYYTVAQCRSVQWKHLVTPSSPVVRVLSVCLLIQRRIFRFKEMPRSRQRRRPAEGEQHLLVNKLHTGTMPVSYRDTRAWLLLLISSIHFWIFFNGFIKHI